MNITESTGVKRRKLAQQHRLGVAGASPSGSIGVTQAANVLSTCSHIHYLLCREALAVNGNRTSAAGCLEAGNCTF